MAENVVLNNLANLQNDTTTINVINGNNATITSAFSDVLSRTGVQPNTMGAPLDMNSWPILNLPAPGSANSPARLIDITTPGQPINISLSLTGDVTAPASSGALTTTLAKTPTTAGNTLVANGSGWASVPVTGAVSLTSAGVTALTNTGTSGHTIPFLDGNNTLSGNNTYSGSALFTASSGIVESPGGANDANLWLTSGAGRNSNVQFQNNGTTKWVTGNQGTASNQFTIFDSAAGTNAAVCNSGGSFGIRGSNTNDNAPAGFVGEYVSNFLAQGSAVALTTGTPANVTSISLTAGDWDCWITPSFLPAASTTWTVWNAGASNTSASFSGTLSFTSNIFASVTPGANAVSPACNLTRISIASTTTIFLVVSATFATSTMSAFGGIQARRVR